MGDTELIAALDDQTILALTLWAEARNEPIEGIVAVGCVIRNRVRTRYMGHDYRSVCLYPWQFSCWKLEGGKANHRALMVVVQALVDEVPFEDPAFEECWWVSEGLMRDRTRDRVGKSRHYHTASMHPVPKWAVGKVPAYRVGSQVFYEGIA